MPYINPYSSWIKPLCELGKQSYYSRGISMCVCHIHSTCKTVIGTAFLALVLRNIESLKKFNLFSFPLWLGNEGQEQPGLQETAEAERGWNSCFCRDFSNKSSVPSHRSKHITEPCPGCLALLPAASLGATSWITQVWFQGSAFLADDSTLGTILK